MTGPTLESVIAKAEDCAHNSPREVASWWRDVLADLRALAAADPLREAQERIEALGSEEYVDTTGEHSPNFFDGYDSGYGQCKADALAALAAPSTESQP